MSRRVQNSDDNFFPEVLPLSLFPKSPSSSIFMSLKSRNLVLTIRIKSDFQVAGCYWSNPCVSLIGMCVAHRDLCSS